MTKCITNRINLYIPGFKTLLVLLFLFVLSLNSYGQNYGLWIATSEDHQETNTSLDLSPNSAIALDGNFEVSFDMSSLTTGNVFGYVVRIIEDNDRNFDLIFNAEDPKGPFSMIVGEYRTKIGFNIAPDIFLRKWNRITIKFNTDKDQLIVSDGHKTYLQTGLRLKKKGSYKLFFGSNSDKKFKTNEALAVKLRNIRILKNNITKYYWPLDEHQGGVAHEMVNGNDGRVKNALWIASLHNKWRKVNDFVVNGAASAAFDSKKELLFIVGEDSLYTFSFGNWVLSSKSNQEKFKTNPGSQSIYSPIDNHIYNFLPDLKTVAEYSMVSQKWNKRLPHCENTNYWHANKTISASDNSMYVFAGYGNWKYKNAVQRFSLKTGQWEEIKPVGDFFTPRYLSALGSNRLGDTVYVLGGYGNASGLKLANPKNIYSMMRFTTRDKRFKKLYDLKNQAEDFAFASSLVIDSGSRNYYGLVFSQRTYNSNLRLIVGSLNNSGYKHIGSAIPYDFHDIRSFADLFYSPQSKRFIAVTLLRSKNNHTKVRVYVLEGPPLEVLKSSSPAKHYILWLFMGLALLVGLLTGGLVLYLYRRKRHIPTDDPITALEPDKKLCVSNRNTIFLFGDFQIFDRDGADITKLFTPLLKELFLLLLVNSVKNGRGLYAEKLDEILWFGRSEQSVRNNRSVNMAKLKSILESIEHCQLLKEAGYWKLEFDYDFWYVDYHNYLDLIQAKEKLDEQHIRLLFELAQRGNFLSNHNYEWLDQFKAEISNEVIDVFLIYAHSAQAHNPEFLIQIANFVFNFDQVSEEAMIIKCRALSSLGKHSLAKKAFDVFIKDYRLIYNEDFNKNFNKIIQS